MLTSQMCKRDVLTSDDFVRWAERIRPSWDFDHTGVPVLVHRKMWEWLFIIQALFERGMLQPGRSGLGFGVGQEPLAAVFASFGCTVLATDMAEDRAREIGWTSDGQFAADLDSLNKYGLCDPAGFKERVSLRTVDMNDIPRDLSGFDFTWSSCAFEHLGSIESGLQFVERQMRCLAPGGVSVHTTELNVSSNDETVDEPGTVLYRQRDLRRLALRLRLRGHKIDLDFKPGETTDDQHVDVPPFSNVHLRTRVQEYVTTSYGLIIAKRGRRRAPTG